MSLVEHLPKEDQIAALVEIVSDQRKLDRMAADLDIGANKARDVLESIIDATRRIGDGVDAEIKATSTTDHTQTIITAQKRPPVPYIALGLMAMASLLLAGEARNSPVRDSIMSAKRACRVERLAFRVRERRRGRGSR